MEVQEILQMVTNNGFAIVMCLLMFNYVKTEQKSANDKMEKILEALKDSISEIGTILKNK